MKRRSRAPGRWLARAVRGPVSVVVALGASPALAEPSPSPSPVPVDVGDVHVRADEVVVDTRGGTVEARGVRIDASPFHVAGDHVVLRRVPLGVKVEGQGTVAFCPCLGEPLAISFDGATIAPPHDLLLTSPTLKVVGLPVLWAPWIWLRSRARLGLLPPEIAWRGTDGLFAGGGVHVPWALGLDVRAGGYLAGGFATEARLRTPGSRTLVRFDRLGSSGLTVDARGSSEAGAARGTALAWDVDVVRGARGVRATSDVDVAARPFDRAVAEVALREAPFTLSGGARGVTARGGDLARFGATGPFVRAGASGALGALGVFDATAEVAGLRGGGPAVGDGEGAPPLSLGRAELGAIVATRAGPARAELAARGLAAFAAAGTASSRDAAGEARARVGLPLARAFASADPFDPWIHRLEPTLQVGALAASTAGAGPLVRARGAYGDGRTLLVGADLSSVLGRLAARTGVEAAAGAGALAQGGPSPRPVLRSRLVVDLPWARASAQSAHLLDGAPGHVLTARARLGSWTSTQLIAHAEGRVGVDPIAARALAEAPLEPAAGLLASAGWTGGLGLVVPWTSRVVSRGGVDMDLETSTLVSANAALELRDRCGCVIVRAFGSRRVGRDGIDVGIAVDLAPPEARRAGDDRVALPAR